MEQFNIRDLQNALAGNDPNDKLAQIRRYVPTKDPRIADYIMNAVGREQNEKVKRAMIQSIGITGKPEHLKKLLKLTEDPSPKIRFSMAKAIVQMGHGSFYPFLVRFLNDENQDIKSFCGEKLTGLGTDKLVNLLNSMWDIKLPWMKISAIQAARQFKTPSLVPLLKKGLGSSDEKLVAEAERGLRRLSKYGIQEATDLLEPNGSQAQTSEEPDIDADGYNENTHTEEQYDENNDSEEQYDEKKPDGDEYEHQGLPVTSKKPRRNRGGRAGSSTAEENQKHCKNCNEMIQYEALKCRYCGTIFDEESLNAIIKKAAQGNSPKFYPAIPTCRIAAYFIDVFPAILLGIIPILGTSAGGMFLISRDGIGDGKFTAKRLFNLKTVDINTGQQASPQQSVIRHFNFIPMAISFLALVPILGALAIGLLAMITGPIFMIESFLVVLGRRRLSDRVAGTAVVHDANIEKTPFLAKLVIALFVLGPPILIGVIFAIALSMGALSNIR